MLHNFDGGDFTDKFVKKLRQNQTSDLKLSYMLDAIEKALKVVDEKRKSQTGYEISGTDNIDYGNKVQAGSIKNLVRSSIEQDMAFPDQFIKSFPGQIKNGLEAIDTMKIPHRTGKAADRHLQSAKDAAKSFLLEMSAELCEHQAGLAEEFKKQGVNVSGIAR